MNDAVIKDYMDSFYIESCISFREEEFLAILKERQTRFPSEENDKDWQQFTEWVIRRKRG